MTPHLDGSRPTITAAVIIQDRRVLMVRRRVEEGQLFWQFPAGKVEFDESGEEAVVREARGRSGIDRRPDQDAGSACASGDRANHDLLACRVVDGTARVVDEEELAQAEWCDRTILAKHMPYPFFEPVRQYLDAPLAWDFRPPISAGDSTRGYADTAVSSGGRLAALELEDGHVRRFRWLSQR